MRYLDALQYLEGFVNYERGLSSDAFKGFNLDNVEKLSSFFGNPHRGFESILVCGTKGKGSTCVFLESILRKSGYKTGLFTSPHIISIRERIAVQGAYIAKRQFASLVGRVRAVLDSVSFRPTFFEILTVIAFSYFAKEGVDVAIVEVGMGGRLDATNILDPKLCIFTPISYDHMDILGKSLGKIAYEKAGIIKYGSTCISARQPDSAKKVLSLEAQKHSASLYFVDEAFSVRKAVFGVDGARFSIFFQDNKYRITLKMPGVYQLENCMLAILACEALRGKGFCIKKQDIEGGLKDAWLPGRMECIRKKPIVLLDGAQNKSSAVLLTESVKKIFRKSGFRNIVLIFAVSKGKDIAGICSVLEGISDTVIITKANTPRAVSPEKIREYFKDDRKILIADSSIQAYNKALETAGEQDIILIAGSFYLVGDIKRYVERYSR